MSFVPLTEFLEKCDTSIMDTRKEIIAKKLISSKFDLFDYVDIIAKSTSEILEELEDISYNNQLSNFENVLDKLFEEEVSFDDDLALAYLALSYKGCEHLTPQYVGIAVKFVDHFNYLFKKFKTIPITKNNGDDYKFDSYMPLSVVIIDPNLFLKLLCNENRFRLDDISILRLELTMMYTKISNILEKELRFEKNNFEMLFSLFNIDSSSYLRQATTSSNVVDLSSTTEDQVINDDAYNAMLNRF